MKALKHLMASLFGRAIQTENEHEHRLETVVQNNREEADLSPWLKALVSTKSCCI